MGRKFISIVGIFFLFLTFYLKGVFYLDPDFGWHFGMGKYILEHGIPKTDPFSYTMPSYPFVDHEWLTNIVIFKLYPVINMWGLSAVAAILTLAALLISLPKGLNRWSIIPLLLSVAVIMPFVGVRPQVETWFFLAILLKISLDREIWQKWRFVLPILFAIWVNFHGGFAVGIVALFIIIALRFWEDKVLETSNVLILIMSLLATLLNPYGIRIWWEIWMQVSDGSLRWSIEEWIPIFFRIDLAYLLYLSFSTLIVWRYRKKLPLATLIIFLIFGLAGISSQRHIPLWLIVALPAVALSLQYFYQEIKVNSISIKRFNLTYKIFLVVTIVILGIWSYLTLQSSKGWEESKTYPQDAINFLKNHQIQGHIFAPYNWGGYLIWKLPTEKVFIDGRMPSWRRAVTNSNESNRAFDDYTKVFYEDMGLSEIFAKYDISTVLWQVPSKVSQKNSFAQNLQNEFERYFYKKPVKPLFKQLEEAGWKEIYQDNIAIVYQKP